MTVKKVKIFHQIESIRIHIGGKRRFNSLLEEANVCGTANIDKLLTSCGAFVKLRDSVVYKEKENEKKHFSNK